VAKEDRWRVLNATHANFSPIFMMFPDAAGRFMTAAQAVVRHRPPSTTPTTEALGIASGA
jgi:hypothetical protein